MNYKDQLEEIWKDTWADKKQFVAAMTELIEKVEKETYRRGYNKGFTAGKFNAFDELKQSNKQDPLEDTIRTIVREEMNKNG